jgi:hypothetical protein
MPPPAPAGRACAPIGAIMSAGNIFTSGSFSTSVLQEKRVGEVTGDETILSISQPASRPARRLGAAHLSCTTDYALAVPDGFMPEILLQTFQESAVVPEQHIDFAGKHRVYGEIASLKKKTLPG